MSFKDSRLFIFVMSCVLALWMTACSPENVTLSNNKTAVKAAQPPSNGANEDKNKQVTSQNGQKPDSMTTLGKELQGFFDSYPQIPTSEQDQKELKDSESALVEAQKNDFKDITTDGDPEDAFSQPAAFEGLIPVTPSKTPAPPAEKPKPSPRPTKPSPSPTPSTPKITPPDKTATDMSPSSLLKNLMCEKLGTGACMAAFSDPAEQSINYYAFFKGLGMGRLIGPSLLPLDGRGYHVKGNSQERRFGSAQTIRFVQKLAEISIEKNITNQLVIGDISKRTGGFLGTKVGDKVIGHKSHQNGLDIDVGFIGHESTPTPLDQFPTDFIANGKLDVKKFDVEKNWQLVQAAVGSTWTYFILAHPTIKKAFCDKAKSTGNLDKYTKVLSQIYPDVTHYNHFHVRLKCPESSPRCVPSSIRPEDPGC